MYQDKLPIGRLITDLSSRHQLRESIVVVPTVFPGNRDTECVDATDGTLNMDTFVSSDLVDWVKANLRTVPTADGWATLGYSAGGWCSSMFTLRHPHTFGSSVNLAGYFELHFDGAELRALDDPAYSLARILRDEAPPVRIFFHAAKDDTMPYNSLTKTLPEVRTPTSFTASVIDTGGHAWPVWTAGAAAGLRWLGVSSPQFAWVAP